MAAQREVIVVGAGLSGLCAAHLLHTHNVPVRVLEAKDRVGGRTFTESTYSADLGGSFIGRTKKRCVYLAKQLGVKPFPVYNEGKGAYHVNGHLHHVEDIEEAFSPPSWGRFVHALDEIDKLGSSIPLEQPWKANQSIDWDSKTMEEWIAKSTDDTNVQSCLRAIVRTIFGAEPYEMSMLFFMWYARAGKGIWELATGAQTHMFHGGAQQLSQKIATQLGVGERVFLSHPVMEVDQSNRGVCVTAAVGQEFKGSHCIVAVPPSVRNNIRFSPRLNGLYHQLSQRVPMGAYVKTFMLYEDTWWRKKGLNGIAFSTDPDAIIGQTYDTTPPGGSNASIMGFVLSNRARELHQYTTDERKQMISEHYRRMFGCEEALYPVDYLEMDWLEEELIGRPSGTWAAAPGRRARPASGGVAQSGGGRRGRPRSRREGVR